MLHAVGIANRRDRWVPFSSKLAFGAGQFAEGLKNTAFGLFALFYYNQVLELSASLAGLALAVALILDALVDPLADSWTSRLGRRRPFMHACALALALAFTGLFWPPSGIQALGEWGLFAWLTLFATLVRGATTLCRMPRLALDAGMAERGTERNRIVAYRQCFGALGVATAWLASFGFFFSDAGGGNLAPANYAPFAGALGLLMAAAVVCSAWGAWKEAPCLSDPPRSLPKRSAIVQRYLAVFAGFGDRPFVWLFSGVCVVFTMTGVGSALELYMLQYFWALEDVEKLGLGMASVAGLAFGVLLAAALLPVVGKRVGALLGTAAWAVCQVAPVVMRMLDWLPTNGTDEFVFLFACKLVQGLGLQLAFVAFGSMIAAVADFSAATVFAAKASAGVGMLLAGVGLDAIDWPRGAHIATTAMPAEALVDLGLFYGPVLAGCSLVSLWCHARCNLSRARR